MSDGLRLVVRALHEPDLAGHVAEAVEVLAGALEVRLMMHWPTLHGYSSAIDSKASSVASVVSASSMSHQTNASSSCARATISR